MDVSSESSPVSDAPNFVAELAAMLPVAAGLVDARGDIVWLNDEARDLFCWHDEPARVVNISELIDPTVYAFAHDIQHRMQHDHTVEMRVQARLIRLDGTAFEADVRGRLVRFGPDQALGLLGVITPSAEVVNDSPFRRALDLQRELICEWSPGGTILYCNRAYREYFGYGDHVIGRNLDEFVEWGTDDSRHATVQRFLDGTQTQVTTRRYDDGRSVEWTNTLVRSDDGDPISILAVGRDITERISSEEALRRNEERFRTMVTYIWDSILLIDGEGTLVDATSVYRSDLDYPPEFWDHSTLLDVVHHDDQAAAANALGALIEGGPLAEAWLELRARRADGSYTWLELNGANLLHDPTVNAVIITVRNIDRRKQIEEELAHRHTESQAALRQRVGFVAQVSHELRNPLHGMLGLSEMLARADLSPELADAAWAIYRQSTTMRRIVDDLLDVAQLEVGTLAVHRERVDLQYVFNDVSAVARESIAPRVQFVIDPPAADLRFVEADPDRARQALSNLLSNACKHTETGEIRITATAGTHPGSVRISVFDTGSGIDGDDVDRLFLPYERGRRDGGPGVGLGLAILKGTVEAMGGTAGAAPRPEGGSVFWLELPSATGTAIEPTDNGTPSAGITRFAMRVLVVDDDPVNLLVAKLQLAELGADVVTASSGEEAWGILQLQHFDVAFIDVQMPGMNGLELVRLVRSLPAPRPLTAVMTASATAADQNEALGSGADTFVPKPATITDVRDVLQRRLDATH